MKYKSFFKKYKIEEDFNILNEVRSTMVSGILSEIQGCPSIKKQIDSSYISNGAVGLFATKDGNAYEIVVRPARLGEFKNLFKKYL